MKYYLCHNDIVSVRSVIYHKQLFNIEILHLNPQHYIKPFNKSKTIPIDIRQFQVPLLVTKLRYITFYLPTGEQNYKMHINVQYLIKASAMFYLICKSEFALGTHAV